MIGKLLPMGSQFRFMAIVINIKDKRGPRNKMYCQLQPKKHFIAAKGVSPSHHYKQDGAV